MHVLFCVNSIYDLGLHLKVELKGIYPPQYWLFKHIHDQINDSALYTSVKQLFCNITLIQRISCDIIFFSVS